MIAVLLLLQC